MAMSQRKVLGFIRKVGGGTLYDLATQGNFSKPYIWSHIQNLLNNGYLEAEIIDSKITYGPRKVRFYKISQKGNDFLNEKNTVKTITI